MTNFSNPYSSMPGEPILEQRTSVMAIIALVCSCVCFLPVLPMLGVVLAVIALVMIAGSNGRLAGRGLAIAALIIGLIFSFVQIGILVMVMKLPNFFGSLAVTPASNVMQAVEAQDYATARAGMAAGAGDRLTDADFERFRTGYQSELGAFKQCPQGWDIFSSYSKIGPLMQDFQNNSRDIIPIPAEFENGFGLIVIQMDKAQQQKSQKPVVMPANIIIVGPTKNKWLLYEGQTSTRPLPGQSDGTTINGPAGTKIEIKPSDKPGVTVDVKPDKQPTQPK